MTNDVVKEYDVTVSASLWTELCSALLLHPAQSKDAVHHILTVSSLLHLYYCKRGALPQHTNSKATCEGLRFCFCTYCVPVNEGSRLLHCSDPMLVVAWLICFHHSTAGLAHLLCLAQNMTSTHALHPVNDFVSSSE